ncbi:MAG: peptidylprolyl isomerase [Clostridia bacterium]|nr:peptidylprolyl isomerase [Clostridia bacterium]
MAKNMTKKIICNTLAVLSASACLGLATACETAHPEVEMTLTFNGVDYTLEYELYRNIAPSTVNHFLWLVDNDYYNGLCVHNYDASAMKMYTGAYSVATEDGDADGLTYKNYFEEIATFENYADFPVSVWSSSALGDSKLYTLTGEFEANGFTVENGAKKQTFGSLTMYYNEKSTKKKAYVPYKSEEKEGQVATREYKYNAATSEFFISLSTTESKSSKYCTFATLKEDSVEVLQDLQTAISEYIEKTYEVDEGESAATQFTTKQNVVVDGEDPYNEGNTKTVSYNVPNESIVIKEMFTKKY